MKAIDRLALADRLEDYAEGRTTSLQLKDLRAAIKALRSESEVVSAIRRHRDESESEGWPEANVRLWEILGDD